MVSGNELLILMALAKAGEAYGRAIIEAVESLPKGSQAHDRRCHLSDNVGYVRPTDSAVVQHVLAVPATCGFLR